MARDALRRSEEATDIRSAAAYRVICEDWLHVARMAAAQEAIKRDQDVP
jgi:hypothetical protein